MPRTAPALVALALTACFPHAASQPAAPWPTRSPATPVARVDPFEADEARARIPVEFASGEYSPRTLIRHATVLTAAGRRFGPGYVLLESGSIAEVGPGDGPAPQNDTVVVDARGGFITPGIIDPHSHMGVYPVPKTIAHDDGNELTDPLTAGVRAEDSFWPQDPAIERAVAGGVTTIGVLPGSGNLVGGRGVVLHLLPQRGARAMRFPGAPEIVKMACGENPKRTYRDQKRAPFSRMGSLRAMREAFVKARKYAREWDEWTNKQRGPQKSDAQKTERASHRGEQAGSQDDPPKPPDRDLALETLALVLRGDILVQWHCYQADDMLSALELADEFGFSVRAFHHALEAYKIRDVLARRGIAIATWDDWWGFKMEAYDGIPENLGLLTEAGVRAAVHSDSSLGIQLLNQAASKALWAARAAGIELDEDHAIRWLTANAAWTLGIEHQVGTLEVGKRADVVIWSDNPLSTYALAERVYVDGRLVFDRARQTAPWSDFELGIRP